MTTKTKSKPPGNKIPRWLTREFGFFSPELQDLWKVIRSTTVRHLQRRVIIQARDLQFLRQRNADLQKQYLAEKQSLQARIEELESQIRQGRQNQAYGMMNAMLNCLEANGRAVHALAEPMQGVLAQLAKDMAQDRQGYVHNSRFDRGKILGYGRGWEKSEALGRQFWMQYAEAAPESGIPKHWPQPSTGGQK